MSASNRISHLMDGMPVVLASLALFGAGQEVEASTVEIYGQGATSGVEFRAYMEYTASPTGQLQIVMHNETAPAIGGVITAFALNSEAGSLQFSLNTDTPDPDWQVSTQEGSTSFGTFDVAVHSGDNNYNGGDPHNGIGVGEWAVFNIGVVPGDGLDVWDFVSSNSAGHVFTARFQSINDPQTKKVDTEGSDNVAGVVITLPLPPSVLAGGLLMGVVAVYRRFRIAGVA